MKNKLDQYYTNPLIAIEIVQGIKILIQNFKDKRFIEPSAGKGVFMRALRREGIPQKNIFAIDIQGHRYTYHVKHTDYLKEHIPYDKNNFIVGNPPFGKRSEKALQFVNKGLTESPYVAMILPVSFGRWNTQKRVNPDAKLIFEKKLPEYSFLYLTKEYPVNCVFQIWTLEDTNYPDIRLKGPLSAKHEDFQTWAYNVTESGLKYFDKSKYNWDIAVNKRGFYDFREIFTEPEQLHKRRKIFFIKAKDQEVLRRIREIDLTKLSKNSTTVPGFSVGEFVRAYKELKLKENERFIKE